MLLARAREGSPEALGELLSRCGERLLALIRLRLGPTLRAQLESRDILQASLVKAIEGFDTFAGAERASLMAWLARIAENEIRDRADFHRRQRRDAARDVPLEEAGGAWELAAGVRSQTSRIALGERMVCLERAIEGLRSEHREAIVLRRLEELRRDGFPDGPKPGRLPDAVRAGDDGPDAGHGGEGMSGELEALLAKYVEAHVTRGERLDPGEMCADHPELLASLRVLVDRYESLDGSLASSGDPPRQESPGAPAPLPSFPGFRTLERLGRGGGGEVYKLQDVTLGRVVAAKVLRRDSPLAASVGDFLREARSLALFEDPRIVRILEYRPADPPVLFMEFVDGFGVDEIGPSLEYTQRARIVAEVAEALEGAHRLGMQHRDLKPSHILVDARLQPKILDFGLSRGEPDRGHGVGTLAYMAPEQLDAGRLIDGRSDVYALGVVFYELLCGVRPYAGDGDEDLIAAIRAGEPRLPAEVENGVPEPLQAVALKAMALEPTDRYASAQEMALDLRRYLAGRPVLARPATYRAALARRVGPHVEQIGDWERLRLIYPHEGERLRAAYSQLEARDEDWIVSSRVLSFAQISLYLGAFLLACGSLLYFGVYLNDAVKGIGRPTLTLLLPFVGLSVLAQRLYCREHRAVAVAFHLSATALLPLALLILFREAGLFMGGATGEGALFEKVTNRQLQIALLLATAWLAWLAARTRTVALASGFGGAFLGAHLALLGDFGLRRWVDEGRWDLVAVGLVPLLAVAAGLGRGLEWRGWAWFAQPLYFGSAALCVAILELFALEGRAFAHLGVTLKPLQDGTVGDPLLLDTVAAMTLNGIFIYVLATLLEHRGTALMRTPARLLHAAAPFATLEPLAYLAGTGEYTHRFDWLYLALALGIAFMSRFRQRRSFYYAGVLNTGLALLLITDHYQWYDRPGWAVAVLAAGALALGSGLGLDVHDRQRRIVRQGGPSTPLR
ncbi:MAG: protein kinase [Acidobacteria bacterium]|nr:protein kinase [Acidobacteriota bacterium]